jgi:hypothetical protein
MARSKVGLQDALGKKVKRTVRTGRTSYTKRSAVKPERINLSNTYGIKGSGRVNMAKPGGLKGAVTQSVPKNKHALANAKSKIRGN